MLVLSRKRDQQIIIGNDVKITVLKIRGNAVRLGIEAPRDVAVRRGELPADEQADQVTLEFKSDTTAPLRSTDSVRIIASSVETEPDPSEHLADKEACKPGVTRMQQIVSQVSRS